MIICTGTFLFTCQLKYLHQLKKKINCEPKLKERQISYFNQRSREFTLWKARKLPNAFTLNCRTCLTHIQFLAERVAKKYVFEIFVSIKTSQKNNCQIEEKGTYKV